MSDRRRIAWGGLMLAASLAVAVPRARAGAAAEALEKDFALAGQAYADGHYDRAQTLFEGLVVAGWRNGDLFFNLGNTYLQLGELGEAVRAYRRAQLFSPRDRDLRHNIAVARGQIEEPPGKTGIVYAVRSLAFWYDLLTHHELALATAAAWLAVCAALAWRSLRPGTASAAAVAVASFACVLLAVTWAVKHYELTRVPAGVVVGGDAEVRAGPGAGQAVSFRATEGSEVTVLGEEGAYTRVRRSDGRQGWVRGEQLGRIALEE